MAKKKENAQLGTVEEETRKDAQLETVEEETKKDVQLETVEEETEQETVEIVVRSFFVDKYNNEIRYNPGDVLRFDKERARDVVERGLANYSNNEGDGKEE